MIDWLTVDINPPPLDTEIIVSSSKKPNYGYKGIYCGLRFYDSDIYSEEEMIDDLKCDKWDHWSNVKQKGEQ